VLGPEFRRLDQAFATIDPKFLNFKSDGDNLEEERVSPPPPAPSTLGDSGAVPLNPDYKSLKKLRLVLQTGICQKKFSVTNFMCLFFPRSVSTVQPLQKLLTLLTVGLKISRDADFDILAMAKYSISFHFQFA
jgi:hypothetical protein